MWAVPVDSAGRGWKHIDARIHPLAGHYAAPRSGMTKLAAILATTFVRRPRVRGRPARPSDEGGFDDVVEFWSTQGELPFRVRDLPITLRDFFTEPFDFRASAARLRASGAVSVATRRRVTRSVWARPSRRRSAHA